MVLVAVLNDENKNRFRRNSLKLCQREAIVRMEGDI